MKDIYRNMNRQNILNFYGSKLDLRLDSSELYDFQISNDIEYDNDVLDIDNEITYSTLIIDSSCNSNFNTPWEVPINTRYTGDTCDFTTRRRTEKGWTLDFVFNKENINWSDGRTFYYWGISGETEQRDFADNNLSFSFTNDGRIKWESYRYSGVCDTTSGYTESFYVSSGQTSVLCSGGTSSDFNITITFDRYKHYELCDIGNEGGRNDMVNSPYLIDYEKSGTTTTQILTGYTVINSLDVLTGATPNYEFIERLNKKWSQSRQKRLGVLKIYLNGNLIYKLKDWEEVIPSNRESDNSIIQVWGGGTDDILSIHTGNTEFNVYQIKYFEEPLNFLRVKHHYRTTIKPNYNIVECNEECSEILTGFYNNAILTESEEYILSENNNDILLY